MIRLKEPDDYKADSEATWLAIFIMKPYWDQIKQLYGGIFGHCSPFLCPDTLPTATSLSYLQRVFSRTACKS